VAGIEFFPKVDRRADLESAKANNSSSAKAKKGEDSFANLLAPSKQPEQKPEPKKQDTKEFSTRARSENVSDRFKDRPSESDVQNDRPADFAIQFATPLQMSR